MRLNLQLWLNYFKRNAASKPLVPWREPEKLCVTEKSRISRSIATFQLGENSEGKHLQLRADCFGRAAGQPLLSEITRLFIAEEQRHAALLGRFMYTHGIACKSRDWTDGVFRRLRHLASYETLLSVLITAELIALVYYRALQQQSGSIVLRCVCSRILCDERAHVEFEASILRCFHRQPSRLKSALLRYGQQMLFTGAVLVVNIEHRKVLRAGGYSFARFWTSCWQVYRTYLGRARLPGTRASVPPVTAFSKISPDNSS